MNFFVGQHFVIWDENSNTLEGVTVADVSGNLVKLKWDDPYASPWKTTAENVKRLMQLANENAPVSNTGSDPFADVLAVQKTVVGAGTVIAIAVIAALAYTYSRRKK